MTDEEREKERFLAGRKAGRIDTLLALTALIVYTSALALAHNAMHA